MATAYRLCVGILTALVLCQSSCLAQVNTTEPTATTVTHCHRHGNTDNCTDSADSGWSGHFSQCPDHLKHYCIHGECRYILDQNKPSCRCDFGYEGHRCEYLRLGPQIAMKEGIIIGCAVAGLVLLILLLVFICVCSRRRWRMCWRRGRQREEPRNGAEKFGMMEAETHTALKALDPRETHTNSV